MNSFIDIYKSYDTVVRTGCISKQLSFGNMCQIWTLLRQDNSNRVNELNLYAAIQIIPYFRICSSSCIYVITIYQSIKWSNISSKTFIGRMSFRIKRFLFWLWTERGTTYKKYHLAPHIAVNNMRLWSVISWSIYAINSLTPQFIVTGTLLWFKRKPINQKPSTLLVVTSALHCRAVITRLVRV